MSPRIGRRVVTVLVAGALLLGSGASVAAASKAAPEPHCISRLSTPRGDHRQVEDRERATSIQQEVAPDRGSIVDILHLDDARLLVLVDLSLATPLPPRPCP